MRHEEEIRFERDRVERAIYEISGDTGFDEKTRREVIDLLKSRLETLKWVLEK